jgi:hypothetical protein
MIVGSNLARVYVRFLDIAVLFFVAEFALLLSLFEGKKCQKYKK